MPRQKHSDETEMICDRPYRWNRPAEPKPQLLSKWPIALQSNRQSVIRLCVSGGDKVSAELEREFTDMAGFPIDEGYGMTEFGLSTINPPSGENRIGSVGKLAPEYEISLHDDSGAEVPVSRMGRLWIRSNFLWSCKPILILLVPCQLPRQRNDTRMSSRQSNYDDNQGYL